MNRLFLILIFVCAFSCREKESIDSESREVGTESDSLTRKLEAISGQGHFSGFAVAIVNKDAVLYQNGFGYANATTGEKYSETTTQPIASISKTLIGVALLKAQEMGILKMNDPVNKYLPFKVENPEFPHINITIGQLATHTSTIDDEGSPYMEKAYVLDMDKPPGNYPDYPQTFNPSSSDTGLEPFLQSILAAGGANYTKDVYNPFAPGQFYGYSNIGASLAALVLEKAANMPYDRFVSKYILQPLAMGNSGFYGRDSNYKGRSHLYTGKKEALPFYHCITYPDGGLVTSAADMAKYLHELIKGYNGQGKLLNKESYAQLFTTYLGSKSFLDGREEENPFSDEYNSGLFIGFSPKGYIGHTGGDPGVSSLMFFDPETGIGRFLMINTDIDDKAGNDTFYAIWDMLGTLTKER